MLSIALMWAVNAHPTSSPPLSAKAVRDSKITLDIIYDCYHRDGNEFDKSVNFETHWVPADETSIHIDMDKPERLGISVIAGKVERSKPSASSAWATTKMIEHPALAHQFATFPAVQTLLISLVGMLAIQNEYGITLFDLNSGFAD